MTNKQFCTGPRHAGEILNLSSISDWHGLYGHCNVLVPDHESSITNYGKHDRIVAFYPDGNTAYCRIDHLWQLGTPSDADIVREFKRRNNIRGRWYVTKREAWPDGKSTDITLTRAHKVHVGYTRAGRDKWKHFKSFDDAQAFCSEVHKSTRIILTIITA